jgi:hypothetical protein
MVTPSCAANLPGDVVLEPHSCILGFSNGKHFSIVGVDDGGILDVLTLLEGYLGVLSRGRWAMSHNGYVV